MNRLGISKLKLSGYITSILIATNLLIVASGLFAQSGNSASDSYAFEEVVIKGKYPGPALWKLENGDNVLWIFGLMNQLPKSMEWDSARVERVISESQEVIAPPRVITAKPSGLFGGARAGREFEQMMKLPEGEALSDLLPPELLASYIEVKELYAPKNRDLNELRPFFAAEALASEAVNAVGLRRFNLPQTIERMAKRHKIPVTEILVEIPFEVRIETMKQVPMTLEISCLETTLAFINEDLKFRLDRANAWVDGDKKILKRLGDKANVPAACARAALDSQDAYREANQNVQSQWLEAATNALETNESTFAFLAVQRILDPEGLVAELVSRGYTLAGQ